MIGLKQVLAGGSLFLFLLFVSCAPTTSSTPSLPRGGSNDRVAATETAFFAAMNAAATSQIATIIALPVATGRPRTPTPSPTPGVTFKYDNGVTVEQRKEIEEAAGIARKYLGEVYNVTIYAFSDLTCVPENPDSPDVTCPNVRGNLGITTGNLIELNLATESWKRSKALRYSVVVHEYAHVVQNYSSSKQAASPLAVGFGPIWLIEGGADYLASWVVASEKLDDMNTLRASRLSAAKRIRLPLRTIETRGGAHDAGGGSEYTLGFLGTEFLAKNYGGEQNVLKFYRATATSSRWTDAFQDTFGVTTDEFYDKFEEYRMKNFPPQ